AANEYEEIIRRKDDVYRQKIAGLSSEKEKLLGLIKELKVDSKLVELASSFGAIKASQVACLLKRNIRLDEDLNAVVLDDFGEAEINENGEMMTIGEKVRRFLDENSHLLRPTGHEHAGSGGVSAVGSDPRIAALSGADLINEGLQEEKRLGRGKW
ncbi:MAG: hypothetical protein KAI64_04620, partial [Thermoplasmata archaeon]|nr:hypothetical protein [Thermoplasmata archaeon]